MDSKAESSFLWLGIAVLFVGLYVIKDFVDEAEDYAADNEYRINSTEDRIQELEYTIERLESRIQELEYHH